MLEIATIGVYGFNAEQFLAALADHGVEQLVDVRQRRGVRGSEYAWANSARLQTTLAEHRIGYLHRKDLAPTTAMRERQYEEDARRGVGQRTRVELAPAFREAYEAEVLADADLAALVAEMPADGIPVLLCVEAEPTACHRSLLAERLTRDHGARVTHILPVAPG